MSIEKLSRATKQVRLNQDLEQLTEAFMLSRKTSNYTPRTIGWYEHILESYAKWIKTSGQDYASTLTLRTYFLERIEKGDKPRTTRGHYRGLKTFFRHCVAEGLLDHNPIERIKPPKVPNDLLEPMTEADIRLVEKALAGTSNLAVRNRALFYLLLDSGIRLAEVASLKVGDINLSSGTFKVSGKGRKDRYVCVSQTTVGHLSKWLRIRNGEADRPLWIGIQGPMTSRGIAEALEKVGKKAGVHLAPHQIRRTFAVMSLKNGMNIRALQRLLGHTSISTTAIYLNLNFQDLQDEHIKASPVEGLSKEKLKVG